MPIKKLRSYLDENEIKYIVVSHSTAYTAQEVAEAAHVSGKELAKTVIVKIEGKMAMVVIPASYKVDFDALKKALGSDRVELADEDEFKEMFPDCDLGAIPPFGNLYVMDVYVSKVLADDEQIAFNAGNHRELIKLKFDDYKRLVDPKMLDTDFASLGK